MSKECLHQDFVKRIGRNHLLNVEFFLIIRIIKSPQSREQLDQFERDFELNYVFLSYLIM